MQPSHPAIRLTLERLKKLPPEEVAEQARLVADLMAHPGYQIVMQLLNEAIRDQTVLNEGWVGIAEYEEFTARTGKLQGLVIAQKIPEGVLEAGRRAEQALQQIVAAMEAS